MNPSSAQYEAIDREVIWAALFSYFRAEIGSNFISMGRRHVAPPDLVTAAQPAFFLIQGRERHITKPRGLPSQLVLQGWIILYTPAPIVDENIGQETVLAATTLNALFQQIDAALLPDSPQGVFTLGGLVAHCWIDGDTDQDPGIFSSQAAAIIPVHILVP